MQGISDIFHSGIPNVNILSHLLYCYLYLCLFFASFVTFDNNYNCDIYLTLSTLVYIFESKGILFYKYSMVIKITKFMLIQYDYLICRWYLSQSCFMGSTQYLFIYVFTFG